MKACAFVLTIIYAAARAAPAGAVQLTAENWDDETDGVCNFVCVRYQVPSNAPLHGTPCRSHIALTTRATPACAHAARAKHRRCSV